MKKYIGLLILSMLSMYAYAGTTITWNQAGCESVGGVWVKANSATDTDKGCDSAHCNAKEFCRSPKKMNWWSAFAWCESIGAKLVDLESACPNAITNNFFCANLNGMSDKVFTNTPYNYAGSGQIYCVYSNGSMTHGANGQTKDSFCALCEQK